MWETLYGMVTAYPIVAFVFIPVYFSLGVTSVYQFLDLRYKARKVCKQFECYLLTKILTELFLFNFLFPTFQI